MTMSLPELGPQGPSPTSTLLLVSGVGQATHKVTTEQEANVIRQSQVHFSRASHLLGGARDCGGHQTGRLSICQAAKHPPLAS